MFYHFLFDHILPITYSKITPKSIVQGILKYIIIREVDNFLEIPKIKKG